VIATEAICGDLMLPDGRVMAEHTSSELRGYVRGITWDHTRGYLPMVAAAQRFCEQHRGVQIEWHKRSLKAFGDQPLQDLAPQFDLLVIDHPFVGYAAAHHTLLALDQYLPEEFLADQATASVGVSHASYYYAGKQWALAIDAATPVSAWRPDLLAGSPDTWEALLDLARKRQVAVPAVPIDSLMHVYMVCLALGEDPFALPDQFAPGSLVRALELVAELLSFCDPVCLRRNPIDTYETLVRGEASYCPFAYGYSNYARAGYCPQPLAFGGLVAFGKQPLRSTLGGTGLAVSATTQQPELALAFAQYVASAEHQRTMYVASGGQPGHRSAWMDEAANRLTNGYFRSTLATLDSAYLRPRYNGYMHFQDSAALLVHGYFKGEIAVDSVAAQLNQLYRASQIAVSR
jgi:multiple sugar transport system substrate-binding protein